MEQQSAGASKSTVQHSSEMMNSVAVYNLVVVGAHQPLCQCYCCNQRLLLANVSVEGTKRSLVSTVMFDCRRRSRCCSENILLSLG